MIRKHGSNCAVIVVVQNCLGNGSRDKVLSLALPSPG